MATEIHRTSATQWNNSFELFVPESMQDCQFASNWARERGMHVWSAFNPKPCYPDGMKDTLWERIVWGYTVWFW